MRTRLTEYPIARAESADSPTVRIIIPQRVDLKPHVSNGASAIGPAMQSVGVTKGRYLFDAIPYVVTLGIMVFTSSNSKQMIGIPAELTRAR